MRPSFRFTHLALIAGLLPGCGSDPETTHKDELHPGNFTDVRTLFWADPTGSGAALVSERRCADGASLTREHLLFRDAADPDAAAFWADIALETLPDGRTSRLLILAGLGHEPAGSPASLSLERTSSGRWKRHRPDGSAEDLPAFDGCDDVEIQGDHVTPGVAVRRLALKPGEPQDVDRVLVRLPGMDLERVKRRFNRTDETALAWEGLAPDGSSAWRIDVATDSTGAVTSLTAPGFQHRVVRDKTIR
ncbi:MAG: putative glycolipid-binding domain-containing protein [Planctomycetota bacterium]